MVYFYFAIYNILQPIALLLEKMGLNQLGGITLSPQGVFRAMTNPLVVSGILLSGVGLIFWLVVLSRFNLSHIQPFGAVMFIVIALLSMFVLHEVITPIRWAGIVVIVIGAYLINQ